MRNIRLLYLYIFLKRLRLYEPFAVIYYSQIAQSYTLGMSIWAIHAFSTAFFEVPTGILSDKIGRKKTLILSMFFSCLCILFCALAQSYLFLVIAGIFSGISYSLLSGTDSAFIFESLKEHEKEHDYHHYKGTYDALNKAALAISALVGSVVVIFYPIRMLYFISLVIGTSSIFALLLLKDVKKHITSKRRVSSYLHYLGAFRRINRNRKLKNLTFAQIISVGIGNATWRFRNLFVETLWPIWAIGVLDTLSQLFTVISFKLGGRLIDRFSHKTLIRAHEYISVLFTSFGSLVRTVFSPLIIAIPTISWPLKTLAMDHLFQQSFDNKKRATMASIVSLGSNFLYSLCALLFGATADLFGVHIAILIACWLQFTSMFFYNRAFSTKN